MNTSVLTQVRFEPQIREVDHLFEPWMGVVFVVALIVVTVIKVQFPAFLQMIRWNFSNYRITRQAMVDGDLEYRPEMLLLFPVMLGALAWFIYLYVTANPMFSYPEGVGAFLKLLLILGLMYLVKFVSIALVNELTNGPSSLRIYLGNTLLLNLTMAAPLLVLSLMVALSTGNLQAGLFIAGAVLVSGAYVLRLIRGVLAAIQERISLNYIILYLCTLEFLPLAVVAKAWLLVYGAR
jgi:hypothetical protein